MDVLCFVNPFICQWIFLLLSPLGLLWIVLLTRMGIWISLKDPDFTSYGYAPRSGIAGSYDRSILNFFLETLNYFP